MSSVYGHLVNGTSRGRKGPHLRIPRSSNKCRRPIPEFIGNDPAPGEKDRFKIVIDMWYRLDLMELRVRDPASSTIYKHDLTKV